jgi:hypothetical protein
MKTKTAQQMSDAELIDDIRSSGLILQLMQCRIDRMQREQVHRDKIREAERLTEAHILNRN